MTIQSGAGVEIAFKPEIAFGAKPGGSGGQRIRRVSSSLALSRQALRSNEIRADAQLANQRPGSRRVQGDVRGELAVGAWDTLLAAALRGIWSEGVAFAAGTGVTASAAGQGFTRVAGSWLADGFKVGDVVRWAGLSPGNDGRNLRIVGLSTATMTVAETVAEVAVANAACSCVVAGRKLLTGTQAPSFTIEQHFPDAGFSQLFTGCRVGGLDLSLTPDRLAEIGFAIVGRDMDLLEDAAAPYFIVPAAPPEGEAPAAADARLMLGGAELGVVTALQLKVDLGLRGDAVVGQTAAPDVFYGRTLIGGTLTAFVEDAALLSAFAGGGEASLHLLLSAGTAFVAVHLPRVIFTGGTIRLQGEHALPIRLPFQALVNTTGGPGTAGDAATMVVQSAEA